jgi:AraC-like DNA-binding protein
MIMMVMISTYLNHHDHLRSLSKQLNNSTPLFRIFTPILEYPKLYLYKRIVQAKLFMDSHYAEKMDLENIADEAHFSRFHFIRLFKSCYGLTPHQYLTRVRITAAKELLSNGHSVSGVCFTVGFESVTSFTALFKSITGLTPSAYQYETRCRQENIKVNPLRFVPNCFAETHGWIKNSNIQEA